MAYCEDCNSSTCICGLDGPDNYYDDSENYRDDFGNYDD